MAIKSARGLDFGGLLLLLQRGQHIEKICQSCIPNTSLDRGHDVFVALVERVVCLGTSLDSGLRVALFRGQMEKYARQIEQKFYCCG